MLQVLSQVSNLFFNVTVDEVQEKAATTIAHTLARLLGTSSDLSPASSGITFISTNKQTSSQAEVDMFIQRCVSDIQESPESMHAGLSSLLLKTIAINSVPL